MRLVGGVRVSGSGILDLPFRAPPRAGNVVKDVVSCEAGHSRPDEKAYKHVCMHTHVHTYLPSYVHTCNIHMHTYMDLNA